MRVRVVGAPAWQDFEGEVLWFGPRADGVTMWAVSYGPGPMDFQLFEDQYVEDVT